jgi:dUTP pyrophosphatase
MKIKLTDFNAQIPTKGSEHSAGYDLYSCCNALIYPQERMLIKTGIVLEIPEGFYGRIAPRSGLALKNGIDVMAGVIDSDYRGDIGVMLYNTDKNTPFHIKIGDRIAQLIIEKYYTFDLQQAEDLNVSERGTGGFGSTGK